MKQLNIRAPFVFRLGVALLCLMLVTFSMVSGLYARYSSTATGEAGASVAKFDVQVTGDDTGVAVDVSQATDNVYAITITNNSDVTVRYTLSVSGISGVSVTFDGNIATSSTGIMPSGTGPISHELIFTVTDWALVTEGMNGQSDSIALDFTITVDIEQVD